MALLGDQTSAFHPAMQRRARQLVGGSHPTHNVAPPEADALQHVPKHLLLERIAVHLAANGEPRSGTRVDNSWGCRVATHSVATRCQGLLALLGLAQSNF